LTGSWTQTAHTDHAAIDTCFVTAPGGSSEGAEIGRFDGKLVMEESDRDDFSMPA
jgi:hypothetical protein